MHMSNGSDRINIPCNSYWPTSERRHGNHKISTYLLIIVWYLYAITFWFFIQQLLLTRLALWKPLYFNTLVNNFFCINRIPPNKKHTGAVPITKGVHLFWPPCKGQVNNYQSEKHPDPIMKANTWITIILLIWNYGGILWNGVFIIGNTLVVKTIVTKFTRLRRVTATSSYYYCYCCRYNVIEFKIDR